MKKYIKQFAFVAMLGSLAAVTGCNSSHGNSQTRPQPTMDGSHSSHGDQMMDQRDQMQQHGQRQMDNTMRDQDQMMRDHSRSSRGGSYHYNN